MRKEKKLMSIQKKWGAYRTSFHQTLWLPIVFYLQKLNGFHLRGFHRCIYPRIVVGLHLSIQLQKSHHAHQFSSTQLSLDTGTRKLICTSSPLMTVSGIAKQVSIHYYVRYSKNVVRACHTIDKEFQMLSMLQECPSGPFLKMHSHIADGRIFKLRSLLL